MIAVTPRHGIPRHRPVRGRAPGPALSSALSSALLLALALASCVAPTAEQCVVDGIWEIDFPPGLGAARRHPLRWDPLPPSSLS